MHAPVRKACSHPSHPARPALAQPHRHGPLLPSPLRITYTDVRRGKLEFVPGPALSKHALSPQPIAQTEGSEIQLYATAHGDIRGNIRRQLNGLAASALKDPAAKMKYTVDEFYDTFVDRYEPKLLRGWTRVIPFVNLSDKKIKTWHLKLLLKLLESGKIVFSDATADELRAVRAFGKSIVCPGTAPISSAPRFENRNIGRRACTRFKRNGPKSAKEVPEEWDGPSRGLEDPYDPIEESD
ncbi:hypothetical protein C8Q76DRAFT_699316 [Earliella scabrosa]|nr:hypothetical protein C8Q76DRAFT_699316 [Earliella scabrosa]